MKNRIAMGIMFFVYLSLMIVGCGKSTEGDQAADKRADDGARKLKLAFVTNNASDFWTVARKGCEKAAQELSNVEMEFKIPADGATATQHRILDDLLSAGVDGIAISPIDPSNQTMHLNQVAKQVLLVCHDSDATESDRACYVGTDNFSAGRQAGELIKQALPEGGKIMLFVGTLDAQNAQERYNGIKDVLAESNVEIVDVRTDDTDRVRAKANVLDTIVKYPDINALVGLWSYNGPAILNAVKESGKVGEIKIICFDEEDETLQGVRDGAIMATVVQQPYEFGYKAIHLMNDVLGGNASAIPADKKIIVPTLAIDQTNVDEFAENLNKLRGR